MTLSDTINQYVQWRQAHGSKFEATAGLLRAFLESVDGSMDCESLTRAQVCSFLAGNGSLTRHRANKYSALAGFYDYAISRGYASDSPLPDNEPKKPTSAPPYIYSPDELHRLFVAIDINRRKAVHLDADTLKTLLLLLYGAGLRLREALHLTLADVELSVSVLTVRNTKFYKSRLVPVGPQLTRVLETYATLRAKRPIPRGQESFFLTKRNGEPLSHNTVRTAFRGLRRSAGIHWPDSSRQPPCLHSFRHTFAVHRLIDWYRRGADVQRLLPVLATYLGHVDLSGTQVYLSMTPELLQEASLRLERYVRGEDHE